MPDPMRNVVVGDPDAAPQPLATLGVDAIGEVVVFSVAEAARELGLPLAAWAAELARRAASDPECSRTAASLLGRAAEGAARLEEAVLAGDGCDVEAEAVRLALETELRR